MNREEFEFWAKAGIFPDTLPLPHTLNDVLAKIALVDKDEDYDVIVEAARPLIFNFDYQRFAAHPLSDSDKEYVELCILNHFITRRIATVHVKKWKHWFKTRITEIMPLYCDMIWSMKVEYNPLFDHELWDEWNSDGDYITQNTGTFDSTVDSTGKLATATKQVTDEEGTSASTGTSDTTTTDTGTVDTVTTEEGTVDTTTDHTNSGSSSDTEKQVTNRKTAGTSDNTQTVDETEKTTKDGNTTESGNSSKTTSGTKTATQSETHNDNRTTVDRYSDTPQSDASKVWEITYDAQGRPVASLTDVYLTNIRGVTESGSGSSSGNSSETTSGTETGTDGKTVHVEESGNRDHDVTTTDKGTSSGTEDTETNTTKTGTTSSTGKDIVDTDTTGKSVTDTDTTNKQVVDSDTTSNTQTTHDSTVTGSVDTDTTDKSVTDTDTTDHTANEHHDEGTHHYYGTRSHTYQALVKEYRENLLHIIDMICDELEPLFYQVVETEDYIDFV